MGFDFGGFMEDIGEFFLGDSGDINVMPTSTLSKEQQQLMEELTGALSGTFGQNTNLENMSLAGLEGYFGPNGLIEQQKKGLSTALTDYKTEQGPESVNRGARADILGQLLKGQPQNFDEYFKTSIQNPLLKSFKEEIMPSIARNATGYYGSDRLRAEDKAMDNLLQALVTARSDLAYKSQTDAVSNALAASGEVQKSIEGDTNRTATELQDLLAAIGLTSAPSNTLSSIMTTGNRPLQTDIANFLAAITAPTLENIVDVEEPTEGFIKAYFEGGGSTSDIMSMFK